MKTSEFKIYHKRNLPHFQPEYGFFSVVIRLAFTLPKSTVTQMINDKNDFNKQIKGLPKEKIAKLRDEYGTKCYDNFDSCLACIDNSINWLSDDRIAKTVSD